MRTRRDRVELAIMLCGVVPALAYLVATIGDPLRLNWGDPWSDCNVQTSGRFFAQEGFFKLAFTPVLDLTPLRPESLRYTHYPPLPDLLNGLQQWMFGPRDITFYRVPAIALSGVALLAFHRFVAKVWGTTTARFAVGLFAANVLFLEYADTIHHVPIYWATGWGALWAGSVWLDGGPRRSLIASGVLTFLCFLASYDYVLFVPVAMAAAVLGLGKSFGDRRVRALLAAGVIGGVLAVTVKTLLVVWAVGGREFLADFVFQFQERATAKHATDYKDGFAVILVGRLHRFFGPFYYVAFLTAAVGLVDTARRREPLVAPSTLLLLVAGAPFVFIFSQLFCEQYHPTLGLLPFFAVSLGAFFARLWNAKRRSSEVVVVLAMAGVFAIQIRELARFDKALLRRDDTDTVARALVGDEQSIVLTNGYVDGVYRFHWNRYPFGVYAKSAFADLHRAFGQYAGGKPLTYVEFKDNETSAYDKMVYGLYAGEHKWRWIANPWETRDEWRERLRADQGALAEALGPLGQVVGDGPQLRVRRITWEDLDRAQGASLPPGDSRFVDFETKSSFRYKGAGWQFAEQYGLGHGFAWMREVQPSRPVFTLKGIRDVPVGPPSHDATVLLRLSPEHGWRIVAHGLSAVPNELSLSVNGHEPVGRVHVDGEARDLAYDVPREHLREDSVQKLTFSYAAVNEWKLGVAFLWLRTDPI